MESQLTAKFNSKLEIADNALREIKAEWMGGCDKSKMGMLAYDALYEMHECPVCSILPGDI